MCLFIIFRPKADSKNAADASAIKSQQSVFSAVEQQRDNAKASTADERLSKPVSSSSGDKPEEPSVDPVVVSAAIAEIRIDEKNPVAAPAEILQVLRADDVAGGRPTGDQVEPNVVAPAVIDSSTDGKQKKKKKGSYADF